MPRPLRPLDPEGIYHVVVRGNNREPVFSDDGDRQEYLRMVRHYKDEYAFVCHAYAFMTNHIHLLLQPGERVTISKLMQGLNTTYTKYFNRRHGRVGHLYQGRFYSSLVDRDGYFLEVLRYIHLNPVRAGMVRHPHAYPWTSYHAYLQPSHNPLGLVDVELVLDRLRQSMSFERFIELGITSPQSASLPQNLLRYLKKVSDTFRG